MKTKKIRVSIFAFAAFLQVESSYAVKEKGLFHPHNGNYQFNALDIAQVIQESGADYISLRDPHNKSNSKTYYKLNQKKYEFQIKDWYLQDWYKLQDMFVLDMNRFIQKQGASTFNEAKRNQYQEFKFNKKKFYHEKSAPSLREWGGLTHPPIKKLSQDLEKYDENFGEINYQNISSPYFSTSFQKELDQVSQSELSFGNTVRAYADNEAFKIKLELIQRAQSSILMSSLAFACDKSSKHLTKLLIQKHHQGVVVKVIVDKMISKLLGMKECVYWMRSEGIEVVETVDFFKHEFKAINHTKSLVVDLKEAVAGGHNMIDAGNLSRGTDFKNRDVDLYVKGPMVTDIAKQFVENWNYQSQWIKNIKKLTSFEEEIAKLLKLERSQKRRGQNEYQQILNSPKLRMNGVCRFIKQAPYDDRHTIGKAYLKILEKLEKHLVITNPIKNDTYTKIPMLSSIGNQFDNFEMFNLLFKKVQDLARKGKKIDYITTSMHMAGNEQVVVMNEAIAEQLTESQELRANWSLLKLFFSNSYFGKPHYRNLMKDWMPFESIHIWTHISFIHSKIFYFDRILSSVGSYNLQHNATDQAYESTAICLDEKLNRDLDQILVHDMANSVPLIFSN